MKKILIFIIFLFSFVLCSCSESNLEEQNLCEIHEFENGICKICGYECEHRSFDDDICVDCGLSEQEICKHDWHEGKCEICNLRCKHNYVDGICNNCGYECIHERLKQGICMTCGFDYKTVCEHTFNNGVCTRCSYKCTHGETPCLKKCAICGAIAEHRIEGAKCTMCDYTIKYTDTEIPEQFTNKNCPEKGTVEKVVFESYDYLNARPYENTFFVYLPYGYDKNSDKEYNVLYLLHGSGENAAYWLAQLSYAGGYTEQTKVVLDNLHYYDVCEDTIVVTPTQRLNTTKAFYKEFLNNIMPLAETLYKTKAHLYGKDVKDVKAEDFISSRDNRAYAGLSQGSMIGWSILAYYQPYFSYYGFYSGGPYGLTQYYNDALKSMKDPAFAQYDIKYAYHSCGNDAMYNDHVESYNGLLEASNGKLVEGVNTMFLPKPKFGHTYTAWIIDLYNSLGYMFFKYNGNE